MTATSRTTIDATVPANPPGLMPRFAAWLAGLKGWRRLATAFLAGSMASLALPPAHLVPLLFVAVPILLWLAEGVERPRTAFALGWWFAFGHFVFGLYWISFALLVDAASYWWLMPFAIAGLPALLAVYPAVALLVLHRLRLSGIARVLAFGALWTVAEWLRGHLFTGFPWNLLGYAWVETLPILQTASVIGIYGLSLVTATLAALPALLAEPGLSRRRTVTILSMGAGLLAALWAGGTWRLAGATDATVPDVQLRLVQPAIQQELKWAPGQREAHFARLLEMTAEPAESRPTHVIWPETAVPFLLEQDIRRRQAIAAVTPPGGLVVTGAPRMTEVAGERRFWNALVALDRSGEVRGTYDKFHLVPFGEYMPLRSLIPIAPVAGGSMDFSAGEGPRTLELPGLPPTSPLICYEVIFPDAVTADARPGWLLNLTNDAWYGRSAGPHQHFAIARVRAVEEGLPLVRVANTGISGIVDAHGRIRASLDLEEMGVLDAPLPVALDRPTPYAVWGDKLLVVLLFLWSAGATLARHKS